MTTLAPSPPLEQLPPGPARPLEPPARPLPPRRPLHEEAAPPGGRAPVGTQAAAVLYLGCLAAYAAIGMVLSLHYHVIDPDGPSRVANAAYVLYSRQPHLAAIGFVWNPLPSLADLPLLALSRLWPPLLSEGQAGTLMAAAFIAGAVVEVRGIAADRQIPAPWRALVVAAFACNPMIALYGGNGMSEAPFAFFLLWSARRLLRWLHGRHVNDLVLAGVALGFGYLTRYETAAAALAATALVVGLQVLRGQEDRRAARWQAALAEGTVFAFPFAVCFLGWTAASWIATGDAFAQFSSQYGNASQTASAASFLKGFQRSAGGPLEIVVRDVLHLEPLLPIALLLVLVLAVRRVELDGLVPLALFGGVLAFESVAQLTGSIFGWYRFFIMAVPLAVLSAVLLWPAPASGADRARPLPPARAHAPRRRRRAAHRRGRVPGAPGHHKGLLGLAAAALLLPSLPATWLGMIDPTVGTQYETKLRTLIDPAQLALAPPATSGNWYVAAYLDRLDLPDGSVLMDTFTGWDVWLASTHRKQFVITSDYDFTAALNDPAAYGIRYILVADPAQDGGADAINRRYPRLYADGAQIATLVASVPASGVDEAWAYYSWRLYRVDSSG